jgi:hypothetical protein
MKNEIQQTQKNEIVIFDREAFKSKFSPKNMRKEFRDVNSLQKAVEADSNSIAVYRKQSSPEFIEGMIEVYLHDLNSSLNVHEKLNGDQVEEIAQEIATLYFHLSLVEIHLVIKNAKRGKYGTINYALNMPSVLLWFDKYAEERCQYFMQRKTTEGIEMKQNGESQIFPKEIIPTIVNAVKGMNEKMDAAKNLKDAEFEIFKDQRSKNQRIEFMDNSNNEELKRLQQEAVEKCGEK